MKHLLPALLLAFAASASPAGAAIKCTAPGARTVLRSAQARVFSVKGKGAVKRRYFGCLLNRKPTFLTSDDQPKSADETHTANDFFRLGGTWVGWHHTSASDFGAGEYAAGIKVLSLAGAKRSIVQDTSRYAIKNLKILADGSVAWVLAGGEFREVDGVAPSTTVPTPIAVARGIDSQSLTLAGGTIGFEQAGVRKTAPLAPPPPPPSGNTVGPQGLDGRFGDCGTLVPAAPKPDVFTGATQLARTPDGEIVAAGTTTSGNGDPQEQDTFVVSRFAAGGQFDRGFGGKGVVQTLVPRPKGAQNAELTDAAVQPDGKVVIAGYVALNDPRLSRAMLARYNTDGTLDESFGAGGIVEDAVQAAKSADIHALALNANGTMLVAGTRDGSFYVSRRRADGTPDTSFGTDGLVADAGKDSSGFNALAVVANGTIFAAGGSGGGEPLLVRFDKDGALLSTTSAAPAATATLSALEPSADGGVIAAGTAGNISSGDQALLARYTPAGTIATSFDGDGFVLDPQISRPKDLAVAGDGSLLITASFALQPGNYSGTGLIRYAAGGARDTSFGMRGALGGVSSYGLDNGDVLLQEPGGPQAGTALVAQDNGGAFAVSRFALEAPATGATAGRSTVCAMATALKIGPLVRTRKLDVSLRLRAPGRLLLTAVIKAGGKAVQAGKISVFRPYTEGAVATIRLSEVAAKLLRANKTAKLTITGGKPGGSKTTYTATLVR